MKRSFVPVIIASASAFALGLVLGAGKNAEDTSLSNTTSKILLTIGFLVFVASTLAEAVRRLRTRRALDPTA